MPKIIQNLRPALLNAAREELLAHGYSGMTIRAVASRCNIAVGTLYNYFPSKTDLIAAFLLEDWGLMLENLRVECERAASMREILRTASAALYGYIETYSVLFRDPEARKGVAVVYAEHRILLRRQLAEVLASPCGKYARTPSPLLPDLVAEDLIAWAGDPEKYTEVCRILSELFV